MASILNEEEKLGCDDSSKNHEHKIVMTTKEEEMYHKLLGYIESIPLMTASMNALLQAEYNDPQKAEDMLNFYNKKQSLWKDTLSMVQKSAENSNDDVRYKVVMFSSTDPDRNLATEDPAEIEQLVRQTCAPKKKKKNQPMSTLDLLFRCANPSLLSDVVELMTGQDLLIQPQYQAFAKMRSSHYTIHYDDDEDPSLCSLNCRSQLLLMLPTSASNTHNPVAEINLNVFFFPNTPDIEIRLESVNVIVATEHDNYKDYHSWLQSTANVLVNGKRAKLGGRQRPQPPLMASFGLYSPSRTSTGSSRYHYRHLWDCREMRFIIVLMCIGHLLVLTRCVKTNGQRQQKEEETNPSTNESADLAHLMDDLLFQPNLGSNASTATNSTIVAH